MCVYEFLINFSRIYDDIFSYCSQQKVEFVIVIKIIVTAVLKILEDYNLHLRIVCLFLYLYFSLVHELFGGKTVWQIRTTGTLAKMQIKDHLKFDLKPQIIKMTNPEIIEGGM